MQEGGFTRKKVESLTLGEKLRKIRSEFRTSLTEISRATRIQVKYLEYLEAGNYDKLPADVYIKGFLRSYARHFSIEEDALLRLYEKERHMRKNLGQERVLKGLEPRKPVNEFRFLFSPQGIVIGLAVSVLLASIGYLYREFHAFASEPALEVSAPLNGASLESESVLLVGKTDARTKAFVNDEEMITGPEGDFQEPLVLRPGTNTIKVSAVNRFGKRKDLTIVVRSEVERQNVSLDDFQEQSLRESVTQDVFSAEVYALQRTRVSIESDGILVYSGVLAPEDKKFFQAREKVLVRSENGKETFVKIGNGSFESLSSDAGAIERAFLAP